MTTYRQFATLMAVATLASCSHETVIPTDSTPTSEQANIYPDYRDITVPPNIAPLNIEARQKGADAFVGVVEGGGHQVAASSDSENGTLKFDSVQWHEMLAESKGKNLSVTIYSHKDGKWLKHPAYTISVAAEPIDRYLSYRLIEPGYELYRQVGLYQRDLEGFTQNAIYENNRSYDNENNHCVNCHNYQNYSTKHMLFHVRAKHGGTVVVENGKPRKVNMKCDSILSSTVYPSWHPTRSLVAFSSNQTGQAFHMVDKQKVEVMDYGSDLVLYDADANSLTNILKTDADLETFPAWSPDGKKLFYCVAHVPQLAEKPDSVKANIIMGLSKSIRYNVMSMTFDPQTRQFGQPTLEVDCASMGKSASVPRVSPDGRYLLFTLGDFGQFHIWHKSSDLYVKDLATGQVRPLAEANSKDVDSYHTWSSNGRWIVFSSRRDDGSYTRPYIAYFDKNGQAHKAFLLPQEDPEQNIRLLKSYNVPELTKDAVTVTAEDLRNAIYNDEAAKKVEYRSK